MSADDRLVAKAVEIFRQKKVRNRDDVAGAVNLLEGYEIFNDLDEEELKAVAVVALGQIEGGGRAAANKASAGQQGAAGRPRNLPADIMSPFRFVTLPDEVALAGEPSPIHLPKRDGFCGTIAYELEAETPLLVGAEVEQQGPHKGEVAPVRFGAAGNYVIPGSTMRGMVRAAVEIVAHGRLGSANLHHRFGLRDFEHPHYENAAKVGRVRAGWLTRKSGSDDRVAMCITPCDWAHVPIDAMAAAPELKGKVAARAAWIAEQLKDKYAALGMAARSDRKGTVFDFRKTLGFGPVYDVNGRDVRDPLKGGAQGVPVFAGRLPRGGGNRAGNKKYEYAFFDRPHAAAVDIAPEIVDDFVRLNSKPSKNRPAPDGSWRDLHPTFAADERLPVFYVGDLAAQGRDFFFGLTRMLKLPHQRSVGDVLKGQPAHLGKAAWRKTADGREVIDSYDADFVENLFGYVVEPKDLLDNPGNISPGSVARKGRVAFSFAPLAGGAAAARLSAPIAVVQSAPRASFAPFYLKPARPGRVGQEGDYSAAAAPRLAGRKRYLPRDPKPDPEGRRARIEAMGQRQLEAIRASSRGRDPSADIQSRLRFLVPAAGARPLVFRGEIKLHNVTAAEIGALLFALTHGGDPRKPYRHMIGRAKPFGAGQMRLRSLSLAVEPNLGASDDMKPPADDERLAPDTRTGFLPPDAAVSLKPFLEAFGARMRHVPGLKDFPDLPVIAEFLGASDPAVGAALDARLDYMPLQSFNPIRAATKPDKNPRAGAPASAESADGRLLAAPRAEKPIFWT